MDREIKFRYWNGYKIVNDDKDAKRIMYNIACECKLTPECKMMQYIGKEDKNGKGIYEGDIVKPFIDDPYVAEIIYMERCFEIATRLKNGNYSVWHYFKNEIEIIGNIYENPELLSE